MGGRVINSIYKLASPITDGIEYRTVKRIKEYSSLDSQVKLIYVFHPADDLAVGPKLAGRYDDQSVISRKLSKIDPSLLWNTVMSWHR